MANFRGTLKGQRGEASRLGSKKTGLVATVNGWNIGVHIEADHDKQGDLIRVYSTGGSNDGTPRLGSLIATLREEKKGRRHDS